jgi:glycosyltransferase involved in cell wall biosynthesis
MNPEPDISIIVPFFNEAENIRPMYGAIIAAVDPLDVDTEIVFVDDGSTDETLEQAIEIARRDARVKVVKFRRNFGQTAAMAAGIEQARGRILVTMDGDLQNDPRDIPRFLAKIDAGHDIVVGWRLDRKDTLFSRKIPSFLANWLIGRITGIRIKDSGCSLKAYRGEFIKRIPLYSDMHRFIPAMAAIAGPNIAEIAVRHHPRRFGRSKYGLSRIYKVLLDILVIKTIVSFSARPLVWFVTLATPLALLGLAALGISAWRWLAAPGDWSLPIAGTGFLLLTAAFMLVSGGAIGELVYRLGDVRETDFSGLTSRRWEDLQNGAARAVRVPHG